MKKNKDTYKNFRELEKHENPDHYAIRCSEGTSGIAVIAPHGGKIEAGTSEIAKGISENKHTFYSFEGKRPSENKKYLHITSTNFDEPTAVEIVKKSKRVIAIHGCKGKKEWLCLGGRDSDLKEKLKEKLESNFKVIKPKENLEGIDTNNICNKGKYKLGVQIELSKGLRDSMFQSNTVKGRKTRTEVFNNFISAIKEVIDEEFV